MPYAAVSVPDLMRMLLTVLVGGGVLVLILALICLILITTGMVVVALSSLASLITSIAQRVSPIPRLTPTLVMFAGRHEAAVFWLANLFICVLHVACGTPFLAAYIIGITGGLGSVMLVRQHGASVTASPSSAETE